MAPASGRNPSYGGRAKTYAVGTPTDSGANRCGHGIYSGPRTSCAVARRVFAVFVPGGRRLGHLPGWVRASGAAHRPAEWFACEIAGNDHFVVCYARSGALVDFASRLASHR